MSKNLQQMTFSEKRDAEPRQSYRGDFHASPIAVQENIWHLMMTAICGANSFECFLTLAQNGSWEKTWGDSSQVKMEGFSETFYGTWPKAGVMRGGIVSLPTLSALSTSGNGYALWPRPIASDAFAWTINQKSNPMHSIRKCWNNGRQDRTIYYFIQKGLSPQCAAHYSGMMMGFPPDWMP